MPIATNRFFVDPSSGNDSNDGRDILGFGLINATYDHTGGAQERLLTSAGAFTAYTHPSGDKIYLLNAVGGVADGLYAITGKNDNNSIYLDVDSGLTSDSTADVDSSSGAWATLQKAADTATAWQEVRLMNTATETTAAIVDMDINAGDNVSGPIVFQGSDSSGDPLTSGQYILQASASITYLLSYTPSASNIIFHRIDFDCNSNVTSYGLNHSASAAGSYTSYHNCKIHDASGDGANIRALGVGFDMCEIYSNGGDGLSAAAGTSSRWSHGCVHRCSIHDNTVDGISNVATQGISITDNEIYDNGGNGIGSAAAGINFPSQIDGNTIYGNTGDGVELTAFAGSTYLVNYNTIVNNTCSGNGGYGFNFGDATPLYSIPGMDYNHTHNNTSGATDVTAGLPGGNNQTGDPQFASVVDGSEDFTPANGSPLDSNGALGVDIGVRKAADPVGGGGGILIHPGMSGGMRG